MRHRNPADGGQHGLNTPPYAMIEPQTEPDRLGARIAGVRYTTVVDPRDADAAAAACTDDMLAAAVRRRDSAALENLYRRYGGACYSLARRIVVDPQLAEDIVQDTFVALWRTADHDPKRGSVATWLLTITHHKAVDVVRRESRRRTRRAPLADLAEVASDDPGPHDLAWMSLRGGRVRRALAELPAEAREVLLLAYYGGYTQREIAGMTGLPLGTVKSRTMTAMRALRRTLGNDTDQSDHEDRR